MSNLYAASKMRITPDLRAMYPVENLANICSKRHQHLRAIPTHTHEPD